MDSRTARRTVDAPTTMPGPASSGWNPSYRMTRMRYVPFLVKGPAFCIITCGARQKGADGEKSGQGGGGSVSSQQQW